MFKNMTINNFDINILKNISHYFIVPSLHNL
jgi:hypothetical protein